jgi:6-phospho-beta-glucosidase
MMTCKPKDTLTNLKAKERFNSYIEQMKLAIEEGVDVIGYLTWGCTDTLNSQGEMKKRYGFIFVNRDETELRVLKRYKKNSFEWFKNVIETNGGLNLYL